MLTWAEFKKRLEDAGVKDDTEIRYIDVNGHDDFAVEVVHLPGDDVPGVRVA